MKKLVSLLVASVFALSSGYALAASHAGAKPMEKSEMKKDDGKAKKAKKSKKSSKKAKEEKK